MDKKAVELVEATAQTVLYELARLHDSEQIDDVEFIRFPKAVIRAVRRQLREGGRSRSEVEGTARRLRRHCIELYLTAYVAAREGEGDATEVRKNGREYIEYVYRHESYEPDWYVE